MGSLTTDGQGRYGLEQLPSGSFTFWFDYEQFEGSPGTTITLEVSHDGDGIDYQDLGFGEPAQAS